MRNPDRSDARSADSAPRSGDDKLRVAQRRIQELEAALYESEARFHAVIEGNPAAILAIGEDGAIRYANASAGLLFGSEPSQLRGTPFGFPLLAGETTELDVVMAGTPRVVEMTVTDSKWDGAPVRLALLRDVTALDGMRRERSAQLASQVAERRLREIISQAPVAIAVLRGPEHRFEVTNMRYEELIAHRRVEGLPIRAALPELEGQGIYELLDQVYSSGAAFVGNEIGLMIERRPGVVEETFFSFVYHPLREAGGEVYGVAIVASDVTPHVRARRDMEFINRELEDARSDAVKANQAKSDFLATMSHELRTPLNAIGGYTDLILAGIRGPISDAQRTDLERINRSQRHLLSVINDILNFAKVEAGRLQMNPRDISMNEALGELESLVAPMLLSKTITYEYRCCDPMYRAHADPERLQQILLNLLSNAAKFTPDGGTIIVQCGATPTEMRVSVSDTGVGIPEDKRESIFEPFVQLERGQTAGMGGTGLGLSISRELARAMGGDLTVESKLQQGSTFWLTVPRVANAPKTEPRSKTESPPNPEVRSKPEARSKA